MQRGILLSHTIGNPNSRQALAARHVLKPGGALILIMPNGETSNASTAGND
jgi:hypothetical protein